MTRRDDDLDRITTLLGQCLGRIDEQAFRLQRGVDDDEIEVCDALENEATLLQELISSAVSCAARSEQPDLNRVVEQSLRGCVAELGIPIVIRQNLAQGLPRIQCSDSQLAYAVQRALMLALSGIEAGGELSVTTRIEGETVLFETESPFGEEVHLDERATTLSEFVESLGGRCMVDGDGLASRLIAMELPAALVTDGQ